MNQIRNNVFETNSSSSHSISIRANGSYYSTDEILKGIWMGEDNVWDLWFSSDLEFDRSPFKPLTTFVDKFKYALASYGKDKLNELESIAYEVIPGLAKIKYPTGYNWRTDKKETYYGYIDHQSLGCLDSFLQDHKVTLRDFLLDSRYIVWIDGDEYCIKEQLFDSGLIDKDDFVEV